MPRQIFCWTLSSDAESRALKDTGWADGLRGLAAVGVVASHMVLCYARGVVPPCCGEDDSRPRLFQLPILRLVASGHSWVAIFFILMGFVNSLKPIQLARLGQAESALDKLAKSPLSRIFRLVLPATMATLISWALCQLGLYQTAKESDAFWLRINTPDPSSNLSWAVTDLGAALRHTWMFGHGNVYDQPQWALIYLLQGSLMVIAVLLPTVSMLPPWRTVALVVVAFWTLDLSRTMMDPFTGPASILGILFAELSMTSYPKKLSSVSRFLTVPLCLLSLLLMSYTDVARERSPWTALLFRLASCHLPIDNSGGYERTYGTIGAAMLIFSIIMSPYMRWVLSRKPLRYLGRISFAIYLLHGIVLRSVFAWVLFLGASKAQFVEMEDDEEYYDYRYPVPGFIHCSVATIVAGAVILAASHMWNTKIEPWFGKITTMAENMVNGELTLRKMLICAANLEDEKREVLPVRQD